MEINEGVFDKHIGNGLKVKLGNDEFLLKPLGYEHAAELMKLRTKMASLYKKVDTSKAESDPEQFGLSILENITDEFVTLSQSLIQETLKKSYPNIPESKRSEFGMKYFMPLTIAVLNANSESKDEVSEEMSSKLQQLRAIRNGNNEKV